MRVILISTIVSALWLSSVTFAKANEFQLHDGDRVLFLGNTLIEREQEYGAWELQLTLAAGEKRVAFRNLGWSGDTVWAESRGLFDPPAAGYQRTLELVRELKPTVIFLGYGSVESFRGPEGLSEFIAQYQKLRRDLLVSQVRLMHLSPLLQEAATYPVLAEGVVENVEQANRNLDRYAAAIQKIANESGELFIDFRPVQRQQSVSTPWMENGLHLSHSGYQATAQVLVAGLGGEVQHGNHPKLVEKIQRKNELFFHRWRPQNFTYLLGFRKHEQGQNAVEIAQFDPLVAELEAEIHALANRK